MARRCGLLMLMFCLGLLASCQQARQYPAVGKSVEAKAEVKDAEGDERFRDKSWIEPEPTLDTPIVFVTTRDAEWASLPAFWNAPPLPAGFHTVHVGLTPIHGLAAVVLAERHRRVTIKVPRGLPDPTPHIPAANPPTLARWTLGRTLFHAPFLKAGGRKVSCATCHDPRHEFAEDANNPGGAAFNAPSLVNVAYNRTQFWDGRVATLEETLFRGLDGERAATPEARLEVGPLKHVWSGFVHDLAERKDAAIEKQMTQAFGHATPTQHAVAQALATYLRTLLSGDSLFDRAEHVRRLQSDDKLSVVHFAVVLRDEGSAALLRDSFQSDWPKRADMPVMLAQGHELFHGKARCAQCHGGPLFTDHDYHNIGCTDKDVPGRAAHVPIGLKEARLTGAYRTPSLRNLVATQPYFHDGSRRTLRDVVDFYNSGVRPLSPHVARQLKDGNQPQALLLSATEKEAIVIYLRSLQGRGVDASVRLP